MSFGIFVASLWRPGGPWDDPGTLGSRRKDALRSRLWFFWISLGFRDPILRVVWVPLDKKSVFVHACVQVAFSDDVWV